MYCARCGAQNPDNAVTCIQCGSLVGQPTGSQPYQGPWPPTPNYLVWAILATIFCCQPFGIAAIVYAAQVNSMLAVGNYTGAQAASDQAKKWCWVAFWVGLATYVIGFIIILAQGLSGVSGGG